MRYFRAESNEQRSDMTLIFVFIVQQYNWYCIKLVYTAIVYLLFVPLKQSRPDDV